MNKNTNTNTLASYIFTKRKKKTVVFSWSCVANNPISLFLFTTELPRRVVFPHFSTSFSPETTPIRPAFPINPWIHFTSALTIAKFKSQPSALTTWLAVLPPRESLGSQSFSRGSPPVSLAVFCLLCWFLTDFQKLECSQISCSNHVYYFWYLIKSEALKTIYLLINSQV